MIDLPAHRIGVALVHPQIAPNTGNIARTCVAVGAALHLVRPLGFVLSDQKLRRSAMDYWNRLRLTVHDDFESFSRATAAQPAWYFDSAGHHPLWNVPFADGDLLIFGSETRGLDPDLLRRSTERTVRIPQSPGERCLNLSTAAGIALYEALRQIQKSTTTPP